MKKLNLIFMLALSLVFIQCGDDDDAGEPCTQDTDCASGEIKKCLSTGVCATSADDLVTDTNKETDKKVDEEKKDEEKKEDMKPSLDPKTCTAPKADKLAGAGLNADAKTFCGDMEGRFTKDEDGGIKDAKLMIEWFPGSSKDLSLTAAKKACEDKGGMLPPVEHLVSLFSATETSGTYLPAPFTDTKGGYYWTGTASGDKQWGVRFKQGDIFEFGTDDSALASVMCWKKIEPKKTGDASKDADKKDPHEGHNHD